MTSDAKTRDLILDMVERIKRECNPEKIILFGSHAYGTPDGDSDIDLLIVKDTRDRPIDRSVCVRRIVSDPRRLIPFDPIVLTPAEVQSRLDIGDQVLRQIMEKGEVLYAA